MIIVQVDDTLRLKEATAVCLGLFDGVHIGHQALIARAVEIAKKNRLKVCVHTFGQLPAHVLNPKLDMLELTPFEEKVALLEALGVDIVAVSTFDEVMMHMRAAQFFRDIIIAKLHAEYVIAGFHHRFGFHGEADAEMLKRLCAADSVGLEIVPPVTLDSGELVSSTSIRKYLRAKNIAGAEAMLGRPCRI